MGLHRLQQQKSCTVYSAGAINKGVWYLQEAEMNMWRRQQHQEVATIWMTEEEQYGEADCSREWSSPAHTRLQLYIFGIVICALINKVWFTYNGPKSEVLEEPCGKN